MMVITTNLIVMVMMMVKVVMAKWMKRKVGPALHDVGGRRGPTSCATSVNAPADDPVHCIVNTCLDQVHSLQCNSVNTDPAHYI